MNNLTINDGSVKNLRENILGAAIEEFGQKGYFGASTNEIVKNAGVSKGLLFHYYKNKNSLYLESVSHVMTAIINHMDENLNFSDNDIFVRIKSGIKVKTDFFHEHPSFLTLIERARYRDIDEGVPGLKDFFEKTVISHRNKTIHDKFYENLDTGKLRDGIDIQKIVDYTSLSLEACWIRFVRSHVGDIKSLVGNMDEFVTQADEIINLIRHGAYF